MLRKIRITAAIFCFLFITLLFLDFSGTLHGWFGWLAKIQFVPALLALNVGAILFLLILTFLFGRIYCSVICPLGVFQDVISWGKGRHKRNRFTYSPAISWLRYGMLGIFIVALVAGVGSLAALLEPYSAYGRIANNLLMPLYQWGNNILAFLAERMNSYTFYSVDVWLKSGITFAIAIATFLVIGILAWRNGRTYCNTICPVGTLLGFISRFSVFKTVILTEKCNGCGSCARNCKASCIDHKTHQIDYSRCVTCMNCIEKCKQNAIIYSSGKLISKGKQEVKKETVQISGQNDPSRRSFLSIIAFFTFTTATKAQKALADGGLAIIENKKIPKRTTPIVPPGSQSTRHFAQHCTACQLCVSVCPNQILRPSDNIMSLMQPEMSYERGYCRPECTKCSEVCPSKAIQLITKEEKSSLQIGHAVWIKENCVVNRDEVTCTSCFGHCPTGAIILVPRDPNNPDSLRIPIIDVECCIGCGACENLCPARPFSAIYVEGHERHKII